MLKRITAGALALCLCVCLLPAAAAEGEAPRTYDQAVAELRSKTGYSNERTMETDECTIFTFDRGGFMNASEGMMVLIYKPGSQLGEGTVIELPHARTQVMNVITPADTTTLSADQKTFTYTYSVKEPIKVGDQVVQEAGIYTYVVDLPTGEVSESHTPLSTDGTYLISITTSDGVVTSGYRTEWRWVALGRADPGRPGILLRGSDPNVTGSLRRSNGLDVGDELDAWGKSQDGKPATLTLGKESWECTARYKDYGYESVLYLEFPPYDAEGSHQPDSDTITLFRYDWAQKDADQYAAALDSLTKDERDDPYEEFSETREIVQTLETYLCTVALTKGKFAGYDDYALSLVYKRGSVLEAGTVKQLILPSTVYDKAHARYRPTDRAPDSISVSGDGYTLNYVYFFDSPLAQPDGEALHEAGTYTYTVDLVTGELSASHSESYADGLALSLRQLGLFLGNESGNFELNRAPSRVEALVMLIRALGEESQAKAADKAHPFTDVPAWADGYVSWGYTKGYTKGISGTLFGADSPADARMYLTFMLRALGYSDTEGDFSWASPYLFARERELLPFEVDCLNFTRGDAVLVTSAALFAREKSQAQTLHERLEGAGVFTPEEFQAAFPSNLFAWQVTLRREVDKALDAALGVGQTNRKTALVQSNTVLDVTQDGALFTVHALVCKHSLDAEQLNDGGFGSYYTDHYIVKVSLPKLAPNKSQILSCEPDTENVHYWDAPKVVLFRDDLELAAQGKMTDLIASGTVQFRSPTYDEAVAELRGGFTYAKESEQTFETGECTVFLYNRGGAMHTGSGYITIIYKPGSAKGDGVTLSPPTQGEYSPIIPRTPDHVELGEDKKTFTYSYHFEEPREVEGRITRAAGDFVYTVDLPTGEVSENCPQVDESVNTYEASLERFLTGCTRDGYTVEKTIEAPLCTLVFLSSPIEENGDRGYLLYAVYKADVDADVSGSIWHTDEGTVKYIGLPTTRVDTVNRPGAPMIYTHHMPDSMTLSEDGSFFTFIYSDPYEGNSPTTVIDLRSGLSDYQE